MLNNIRCLKEPGVTGLSVQTDTLWLYRQPREHFGASPEPCRNTAPITLDKIKSFHSEAHLKAMRFVTGKSANLHLVAVQLNGKELARRSD